MSKSTRNTMKNDSNEWDDSASPALKEPVVNTQAASAPAPITAPLTPIACDAAMADDDTLPDNMADALTELKKREREYNRAAAAVPPIGIGSVDVYLSKKLARNTAWKRLQAIRKRCFDLQQGSTLTHIDPHYRHTIAANNLAAPERGAARLKELAAKNPAVASLLQK